jgi:hypothetical protein
MVKARSGKPPGLAMLASLTRHSPAKPKLAIPVKADAVRAIDSVLLSVIFIISSSY